MTVPMIIDTDPGVDDAVALMVAAASPEVQLLAVTTVFGNAGVDVTTANALRLRTLAGLGDLPVAAGAARPLVYPSPRRGERWHGRDGLGGHADLLPQPSGPINALGAVTLMATLLRGAVGPVTLVAIAPLTNIALLLAVHPELKARIRRIVIMGGNLDGSPAEFNIGSDPEAARRVLVEEDVATTLVPLNLTMRATIDDAWLAELAQAGPRCAVLAGIIGHCRQQRATPVALHDSLAVLEAAVAGTLTTTPMALEVSCDHGPDRGAVHSVSDQETARVVEVACDTDLTSINAMILHRLVALR